MMENILYNTENVFIYLAKEPEAEWNTECLSFWMPLIHCVNSNNNKLVFASGVRVTVQSRKCVYV